MSTGTVAQPAGIRGAFEPLDELLLRVVPLVRPMFSEHVRLLAFEDVVDAFGGKAAFNARVGEMLNIDFYEIWIKESEDAGYPSSVGSPR